MYLYPQQPTIEIHMTTKI